MASSSRRPRGAYVNTAEALCSIFESGRMVFRCLSESPLYDLDYYSLGNIDVDLFHREGVLRTGGGDGLPVVEDYDFYVFNWHFITMASVIQPDAIKKLKSPKFTVVLELAPDDPLKLVPPGVFDGYIALDPSAQETRGIVAFPRPLERDPWTGTPPENEVPVIASFGFGTPGKGFELLVEAVNREFDHAIVRINVPFGTYVFTDNVHGMSYPQRLAEVCRQIAKPGIEVRFTNDYMTPEELVSWCGGNDLNCFMYTRAQPGLSATTDQCIISGRPLLTLTNDTFRHVHRYIPPYPLIGLREAISKSEARVRDIQKDWSREGFRNTFHSMLGSFGVLDPSNHGHDRRTRGQQVEKVLILSPGGPRPGDILDYAQRVADSLGRSGSRTILHIPFGTPDTLAETISRFQPMSCILVDVSPAEGSHVHLISEVIVGPKLYITQKPDSVRAALVSEASNVFILPRQPIVPFHTTNVGLCVPRSIWLLGFGSNIECLETVLEKIGREISDVDVLIEVPEADRPLVDRRIQALEIWLEKDPQFRLSIRSLPLGLAAAVVPIAESSLIVVHNDLTRTWELEGLACVGMVTERPVIFTRHGAFPRFLGRGTYIEDHTVPHLLSLGVAAHIKAYYDFGEWTFAATVSRLLEGSWRAAFRDSEQTSPVILSGIEMLQVAALGTGAEVEAAKEIPPLTAIPLGSPATVLHRQSHAVSYFILVGVIEHNMVKPSAFVTSLVETWRGWSEPIRTVLWNSITNRLHLVNEDQWYELSGPAGPDRWPIPVAQDNCPVLLEPVSCGPQDWLVMPETLRTSPSADPLMTMNVIREGRRLKMKSACIFHGAGVLAAPSQAPKKAVEDHALYMQALLLADVVLPVSDVAADDLGDVFADYELAEFGPSICPLPIPKQGRFMPANAWMNYVRALRGKLSQAADIVRRLGSFYYLADGTIGRATEVCFADRLAQALMELGVRLIATRWDEQTQRFLKSAIGSGWERSPTVGWTGWMEPGTPGAPDRLLITSRLTGAALESATKAAHSAKMRVAVIVTYNHPSGADHSRGIAEFAALAKVDKVLSGSERQFDELYRYLLSSPDKVLGAEDRFKIVETPREKSVTWRRAVRKPANLSVVRVIVWLASQEVSALNTLFVIAKRILSQTPVRVKFNFVNRSPRDPRISDEILRTRLNTLPGAQWDDHPAPERAGELLQRADFAVYVGGEDAEEVAESLSQGLPCLVLRGNGPASSFPGPGIVRADLREPDAALNEFLKLLEPTWRQILAREALSRPVREWREYAIDIANALTADALSDRLYKICRTDRPDISSRFGNLTPRPKLSVCISTYNRGGWVDVNLRNIFAQIPEPRPDLEVLVVDNTSTDNTPEIVRPFFSRPDFRYIRNPKNVGILGNLAVTAQRARGKYVWILGDDDLTREGTIERVLAIIGEQPKIAVIYMNYGYSSEKDPANVTDLSTYLNNFNHLEPAGPDQVSTVKLMAAKSENFYTAIYALVFRRDHAMRAYCQDTSERIFSTMLSCIPTSYYMLHYMADASIYWMGQPAIVVNSNVSWGAYGTLFDLEQLPRTWDLAERMGCPGEEVDRRRANRIWLVEMMWKEIFEDDRAGNAPYFSASRVVMRLKHLDAFRERVPALRDIYVKAQKAGHPATQLHPDTLFSFPW